MASVHSLSYRSCFGLGKNDFNIS